MSAWNKNRMFITTFPIIEFGDVLRNYDLSSGLLLEEFNRKFVIKLCGLSDFLDFIARYQEMRTDVKQWKIMM